MNMEEVNYIEALGKNILKSKAYQDALKQKHHFRCTVGVHMMDTAYYSYKLCKILNKLGIKTDTDELIIACLCHDLGIVGNRYNKYKSGPECCRMHPLDSIPIADSITGGLTDKEINIIKRHMWPVTVIPPKCKEGFILTIVDKYCAICESTGIINRDRVDNQIRIGLLQYE